MEGDESKPPSLPKDGQSEHSAGLAGDVEGSHLESTNKHLSSTVKNETVSDKKLVEDGNTKLKPESQKNESHTETEKSPLEAMEAEMIALQKQAADLQLMISESDSKIKTMEEEIERSRKCLSESDTEAEKSHIEAKEAEKIALQKQTDELKLVISDSDLKIKTIAEELERSRKCLSGSDTEAEKSHLEDNEAEMVALQKQVDDFKLVISESDSKIKAMEEELESSAKGLSIAKETISSLQGQLKHEVGIREKLVSEAHEKVVVQMKKNKGFQEKLGSIAAEIVIRDDEIAKLKTKNERYKSDVSQLEETLKTKEGIWNRDVIKLKEQVNNKTKAFDDLKKQLNFSRSDRNRLNVKIDTLKEEKGSQEKLIQELQTSLNALQVEHDGLVSSYESTEKLNDYLTLKVVELEREVDRQGKVISVTTEEKTEVISQLNTSRSDNNTLNSKLETLEEEKCSQEKLIQELQTRLNALQGEHERVVSLFENAEKLKHYQTLKVVDLEGEVDRQREVISVTIEEKMEAIRQLSFSLEHYMSKYKQLRELSAANKTFCFSFLSGLNTNNTP